MRKRGIVVCLVSVTALLGLGSSVQAQQAQQAEKPVTFWVNGVELPMQTFVIENGKVLLNGQELRRNQLPAELSVDGVRVHHTYFGESLPFTVGGRWFVIDGDKVVLHNERFANEGEYEVFLQRQAESFEPIQRSLMPLEGNRFLFQMKDESPDLYSALLKENWLENQTRMLGVRIQVTQEGDQRRRMTEDLRNKLDTLFELKLANQEEEIRQLSQQLIQLRSRVADRKKAKDEIIEQRLLELIGQEEN